MDVSALAALDRAHQHELFVALHKDAFFVPCERMEIDRSSGAMRLRYLRTTVTGDLPGTYILLFTKKVYWQSLGHEVPGLVQPPLAQLHADIGNVDVVVDLGSPQPFTANLNVLLALRDRAREAPPL